MSKKAIIVGASGLIGSALLAILLNDSEYSEVLALVRTPLNNSHPKFNQIAVDFDKLDDYAHQITGDVIFCALGSTKRKTPDLNIYRKIDHDYPLKLAEIAVANGVNQFHLISSLGANKNSSNFYIKMKGETEADIKTAGLYSLVIYRPSLLTGDRKEHRFAEGLMQSLSKLVNPLLIGGLKKYRSIEASTVAKAMDNLSHTDLKGIYVYESDEISEAGLIY
ncbi:oxidoreductase [Pedobacter sp. JCM 36344]|uniref:oxidoreductase n=1 Tax=Pedobacter sp. JCM 36344 TaxID=3374280 RepID=UPI00397C6725